MAPVTFAMHRAAGVSVSPPSSVAVGGHVVVLSLGAGPCRVFVLCKVVWTVDTAVQAGFAYGTLPGHDECGEESFIVEIDDQGEVWFTVTAFSRPDTWYARLGAPINNAVQRRITTRYLQALITCVRRDTG